MVGVNIGRTRTGDGESRKGRCVHRSELIYPLAQLEVFVLERLFLPESLAFLECLVLAVTFDVDGIGRVDYFL